MKGGRKIATGEGQIPMFGGTWTGQKLAMLRDYLSAYRKAMKNQPFELTYIDGFAGAGYRELRQEKPSGGLLLPELAEEEPREFLEGSARIALKIDPPFHEYVFVEKDPERVRALNALKAEFPSLAERIQVKESDCNVYISDLCGGTDWQNRRAVLFLDPFGMQVEWSTLEAVALTKAIDVWILFPLGSVMRLLKNDGNVPDTWSRRLDSIFGEPDWRDAFYEDKTRNTLFGAEEAVSKTATFDKVSKYWVERLKSSFSGVADNPKVLHNSGGTPLFLFCFAVSNPSRAARALALKIAGHILNMRD